MGFFLVLLTFLALAIGFLASRAAILDYESRHHSLLFEPLHTKGAAAFEFGGVPLHPGVLRAYREAGWLK